MTGPGQIPVPDLLVVRGPAGEATGWARTWVAANPGPRCRVNTADVARMLFSGHASRRADRVARAVRTAAVEALLRRGVSVVVDDPLVDDDTVAGWDAAAWACAAHMRVVDLRPGDRP